MLVRSRVLSPQGSDFRVGGNDLETHDARSQVLLRLTTGACIPSAQRHQKVGEGLPILDIRGLASDSAARGPL